ncbi:MAG: MmgE/PrpD family protein [Burkholderiales bacterium]
MPPAVRAASSAPMVETREPLAVRMAHAIARTSFADLPGEVIAKAKLCLFDLIGCAFESRELPWSRQAVALAEHLENGATVIGSSRPAPAGDAAFANAVMGHGLVREDMHSGSISHLGIVVLPTLLALAQTRRVSGRDFIAAAVAGYEVGARTGRAVMNAELARIHRPTGITGPLAGAAAGARLLGLDADQTTSALALAANTTAGFNQWAHTGGSEMYFHPGFAARNAVAAVRLAQSGAFASPSALDGEAGLFASLGKRWAASQVELFRGTPEILSVYHKAVPVCNFAQTPTQAALGIADNKKIPAEQIASIAIRVPRAGAMYPGCDFNGPFDHVLQAKMSIQFNVAAALIRGGVSEENFTLLGDGRLHRLIGITKLEVDEKMTAGYPGKQGGEVEVRTLDGQAHRVRLEDVVHAQAVQVRERFLASATQVMGTARAREIEDCIGTLDASEDAGRLGSLLRA